MAQKVGALAAKAYDLNSIPEWLGTLHCEYLSY